MSVAIPIPMFIICNFKTHDSNCKQNVAIEKVEAPVEIVNNERQQDD